MTAPTPGLSGDELGWEFRAGLTNEQFADWLVQRVRDAEAEALEKGWDDALNAIAWCMDNGAASGEAAFRYVAENNPHRERAAGVRGGASSVRRFIDQLPNDRFTERETERLREWADEVGA